MNKQFKQSMLVAVIMTAFSSASFAQGNQPTSEPVVQTSAPVQEVKQGNAFEKEVTPLLREISRKKSQLELRKLDRELEKIDEESLKAQLDMESLAKGGPGVGKQQGTGVYDPFATSGGGNASLIPNPAPASLPTANSSIIDIAPASNIKVLMIYGFDGNLSAKIAAGQQGGYVVKKGDVMPDGRVVENITSNYIEIKKSAKKSAKGLERIFVSVQATPTPSGTASPTGGVEGSTNVQVQPQQAPQENMNPQAQANERAAAQLLAPIPSPGMR
jgi:hypothetical protein